MFEDRYSMLLFQFYARRTLPGHAATEAAPGPHGGPEKTGAGTRLGRTKTLSSD